MKKNINDLAIFNGPPLFKDLLHVGCPNIPPRDFFIKRIHESLDRQWLTNRGPFVKELEEKMRDYCGVKHCILTCNGTTALQIAIKALDLTGEVIVPSFTFVATAHSVQWVGLKPVFCDVDPVTHTINPEEVKKLITPKTSGIIGVHLWGRPCDTEALEKISAEYQLKLIFDAAHAFGASKKNRMIGSFGNCEVMSFHATKFFNTLEGGAVTTNDDALAERIRLMINFGFEGYDNVICAGTNGKMNEVSAAMGLTMMDHLKTTIEDNESKYALYERLLGSIEGIQFMRYNGDNKANYQFIVLELDESKMKLQRDLMIKIFHAENIVVRRYFYPGCHRMEPYRSQANVVKNSLKETEALSERIICLPTGPSIDKEKIENICAFLKFIIVHGSEISDKALENIL